MESRRVGLGGSGLGAASLGAGVTDEKVEKAEVEEEEEDYMSMDILQQLAKHEEDKKAKMKMKKKKKEKKLPARQLPRKVMEAKAREEGLQTALSEDNKGFKLLQRMGYKQGSGLGREGQGMVDPIELRMRRTRECIGRIEEIQKKRKEKAAIKESIQKDFHVGYMNQRQEQFRVRKAVSQTTGAMKVCVRLDEAKEVTDNRLIPKDCVERREPAPALAYDGTDLPAANPADEPLTYREFVEGMEDDMREEYREALTYYLRTRHHYCFYCACQFTDQEDLEGYCPGLDEAAHD